MKAQKWVAVVSAGTTATIHTWLAGRRQINCNTDREPTPGPPPPTVDGRPLRLIQAQAVFRHGARTPGRDIGQPAAQWLNSEIERGGLPLCEVAVFYPGCGDAVAPEKIAADFGARGAALPGGAPPMALTRAGMEMALGLGARLRERYVDEGAATSGEVRADRLLPSSWESSRRLVAARSSRAERTVGTAQGVLSGIFPESAASGGMRADVELSGANEFMVPFFIFCPRGVELRQQAWRLTGQSSAHLALESALRDNPAGWGVERSLDDYHDYRTCLVAAGKPVPTHIQALASPLEHAVAQRMIAQFEGGEPSARTEALRLSIGRLLSCIVDTMERPDGRLHLYSGHDWTLGTLLACILQPDQPHHLPTFCSCLSFEVWSRRDEDTQIQFWPCRGIDRATDDGRFVRLLFNGKEVEMPCGGKLCSMADFKKMVGPFTCSDFEVACKAKSPTAGI